MEAPTVEAVQRITGRAVIGYHSQIVFDPERAFEIFVLDRPVDDEDQQPVYEFLLTVHVLCAVIWVGGAVMMHVFGRLATKDGPEPQLIFTQHSIRLGNLIFAPLSVILLVAGVLLVDEVGY